MMLFYSMDTIPQCSYNNNNILAQNNNDVKKYFTSEFCRSTNVGDSLEIAGDYYKCEIVGFKKQ